MQHISMIDFVVVSARWDEAMCEHAGQLHEHFLNPIKIERGRYKAPIEPGFSAQMKPQSIAEHIWRKGRPDSVTG
jgi:L-fuconate dehydratase